MGLNDLTVQLLDLDLDKLPYKPPSWPHYTPEPHLDVAVELLHHRPMNQGAVLVVLNEVGRIHLHLTLFEH